MSNQINVAVVGSTGYGGVELIRLLEAHPLVEITSVISSSSAGAPIAEGFPHLTESVRNFLTVLMRQSSAARLSLYFWLRLLV